MTDFSFFGSESNGDQSFDDRYACTRRFLDLANPSQAEGTDDSELEDLPAHPEIIELIESLLDADPNLLPSNEMQVSQRASTVYLPEHYEAGYAYPLIVWFHGDGASENELHRVMPMISDRNYIGVALRGDVTSANGCSWSADAANSPELMNDVRLIATALRRQYHIHSERIYLAGFGSGATTAVKLMLNKPEWFGGVISFSGEMPSTDAPMARADELKDKRVLLATNLSASKTGVGDVVAAGRMLYSVGMKVGTRVYQDSATVPTTKMLRDLDSWLMDDICGSVKV